MQAALDLIAQKARLASPSSRGRVIGVSPAAPELPFPRL